MKLDTLVLERLRLTPNSVILIKLSNGGELIGKLTTQTDEIYFIKDPLVVVGRYTQPNELGQQQLSLGFSSFFYGNADISEVPIDASHVISIVAPNAILERNYIQTVSSIII